MRPGRRLGIFDELMSTVAARFPRVKPRRRARAFMLRLLADLPRKNCWAIAEHAAMTRRAGAAFPGSGRLAVRDGLRGCVTAQLDGQQAVLAWTGDLDMGHRDRRGAAAVHRRMIAWPWTR